MDDSLDEPLAVSVVIPCFNEEEILPTLIQRLAGVVAKMDGRAEVIIVNDGSSDSSESFLKEQAADHNWLKALQLGRNFGHQIAISAGLDYARGDAIIIMDGDLQDPPELIPEIVDRIKNGADVVHMQRNERAGETFSKVALARTFYWLFHKLALCEVVPNCGDFRGVSRRALDVVRNFREPHKFHRAAFAFAGLNQEIMPFDRDARFAGETKYPLVSLIKLASNGVMSFTSAPLRLVIGLSFLMWGVALLVVGKALIGKYVMGHDIPGWTTLVVLQVFLTGVVLFALAIIGEYVRRVFEQGQNRPLYWIRDSLNLPLSAYGDYSEQRLSQLVGVPARMAQANGMDSTAVLLDADENREQEFVPVVSR